MNFQTKAFFNGTRFVFIAILLLVSLGTVFAQAAEWEFRVCAEPNRLPYSHRELGGYENELAHLLAREMGARATFNWVAFSPDMINLELRGGECDAILGVADGQSAVLTTLSYYRSPYVFVTREGLDIESLNDPRLRELSISVQNVGIPPHEALLNQGIYLNVQGPDNRTPNTAERVVMQVARGEVDVGIVWGPAAGFYGPVAPAALHIEPVTPEIAPPFLTMSVPMTIAVRPGDYSLRDRLDEAIIARWDDIQELLQRYGVPLSPLTPPVHVDRLGDPDRVLEVGVLLPMVTGNRTNSTSLYDLVGQAARQGVEMATGEVNSAAGYDRIRLHMTSTPDIAAAERAAARLVAAGVDAIIGGIGEGQAQQLAVIAEENDILFLNIGDPSLTLREQAHATTLHVEPSLAHYIGAAVEWHAGAGTQRWAIVHDDSADMNLAASAATSSIAAAGGELLEVVEVTVGQPVYLEESERIRSSGAEAVLLLLGPADQIAFMGQFRSGGAELALVPLPVPVTQTRDFLSASLVRSGFGEPQARVVTFEPTRPASADITERYHSRFGEPMEATAFAGYQAVSLLGSAAAASAGGVEELLDHLLSESGFTGPKGPVGFCADGQLQQPLDVIALDPAVRWDRTLRGMLGIAEHVESISAQLNSDGTGCR